MIKDLDLFMEDIDLDALWIFGGLQNNANMVYFTGIHHVANADLFKIRGKEPVLFHSVDMEREEATKSGLETHSYFSNKPFSDYLNNAKGNYNIAHSTRIMEAMELIGLSKGRVAISGKVELGKKYAIIEQIKSNLPKMELISLLKNCPVEKARMTKTKKEIERIRNMGKITTEVISRVKDFLQSQKVIGKKLVFPDETPIKVKDVKSKIRLWLAELGAENPKETIFSTGRDCGIPHNSGNPEDILTIGIPIVFDIFPCEAGGGYFFDCTRSWCLGFAPDEVRKLHKQVLDVHHQIIDKIKMGNSFSSYHKQACDLFEKMGHNTIAKDNTTKKGYLHSIGHGVGLNVHEKPLSGIKASKDDLLKPGVVFTIEPGLYYPDKGIGIRIEDTICLNEGGEFEILAEYPYDLVIPVNN